MSSFGEANAPGGDDHFMLGAISEQYALTEALDTHRAVVLEQDPCDVCPRLDREHIAGDAIEKRHRGAAALAVRRDVHLIEARGILLAGAVEIPVRVLSLNTARTASTKAEAASEGLSIARTSRGPAMP